MDPVPEPGTTPADIFLSDTPGLWPVTIEVKTGFGVVEKSAKGEETELEWRV